MDPEHAGIDDRAPDPYDRWVVRFPSLRRSLRRHRFAMGAVCLAAAAALITPAIVAALSYRGSGTLSAAAAPTTTATPTTTTTGPIGYSFQWDTQGAVARDETRVKEMAAIAANRTTTQTTGSGTPTSFNYTAIWNDTVVTLSEIDASAAPAVAGVAGQLTAFVTDDPNAACLTNEAGPTVYAVNGDPTEFLVRTTSPADCTTADFVFTSP